MQPGIPGPGPAVAKATDSAPERKLETSGLGMVGTFRVHGSLFYFVFHGWKWAGNTTVNGDAGVLACILSTGHCTNKFSQTLSRLAALEAPATPPPRGLTSGRNSPAPRGREQPTSLELLAVFGTE